MGENITLSTKVCPECRKKERVRKELEDASDSVFATEKNHSCSISIISAKKKKRKTKTLGAGGHGKRKREGELRLEGRSKKKKREEINLHSAQEKKETTCAQRFKKGGGVSAVTRAKRKELRFQGSGTLLNQKRKKKTVFALSGRGERDGPTCSRRKGKEKQTWAREGMGGNANDTAIEGLGKKSCA